jgi:geranylgeranyl pyrophosphate synthase
MMGAEEDRILSLATAIELLHTATLVHDDLIDSSLLRRGMPTLNSQWSSGATVLAGDFIFARAARMASQTDSIPVMKLFSETLSTIVNGEITQLFLSQCSINRDEYFRRIYSKTASLFETTATSAALLSPVSDVIRQNCRQYGYNLGMDDILDFIGDETTLGKPIGNDLRHGLITLPLIIYIEDNPHSLISTLINNNECPQDNQINQVLLDLEHSNAIQKAMDEAAEYINKAIASLEIFAECEDKTSLEEMARYVVQRKK